MQRYEFSEGTSNKFWEVSLEGCSVTTRYGRIGSDGQVTAKDFDDEEKAQKGYDKLVKSKVKKGYQLVTTPKKKAVKKKAVKKKAVKKKAVKKKAVKKKAVKKKADDFTRYELSEGTSNKFWEIRLDGNSVWTRYGRIEKKGQLSVKDLDDAEKAEKEYDKLIKSKLKKGYQLVGAPTDAADTESEAAKPQPPGAETASLEAAILEDFDNVEAWQVYADDLQTRGDPRGELIAIELALAKKKSAKLKKRHAALFEANKAAWMGELASVDDDRALQLEWKYGFIVSARVASYYGREGPKTDEMLEALMATPSAKFLQKIAVGVTEGMEDGDADFGLCVLAISQGGKRPSVGEVHIGDFDGDDCEISWSSIGEVASLYRVLPNMRRLRLHGGLIELGKLKHDKLEVLTIETGGLPAVSVKSLAAANLPSLERLEVWFGDEEYGAGGDVKMLKKLFAGKGYPKLRQLGLQNAEFEDDIAKAIVKAPILEQLLSLDLSMGTMTDTGAQALIDGAKALAHLETINVDENAISDELVDGLKETFGDRINIGDQEDSDDPDDIYVSVGE